MILKVFFKTTSNLELKRFFKLFSLYFIKDKININNFYHIRKKKKKKQFSILKSPHVNKKAGKTFKSFLLKGFFLFYLKNITKFIIFLKKFSNTFFSSIYFKISFYSFFKKKLIFLIQTSNLKKKNKMLLNNYDIYGEYKFKIRKICS